MQNVKISNLWLSRANGTFCIFLIDCKYIYGLFSNNEYILDYCKAFETLY